MAKKKEEQTEIEFHEPETVEAEVVETLPATTENAGQLPAVTPMDLIAKALDRGDMEQMEKLLDLQIKFEENEAKKAFNVAFAKFKAAGIQIVKDSHVEYSTSKGKTEYDHATLAGICDQVVAEMSKHGLSHYWDVDKKEKMVEVTCVIVHELGHSISTSLDSAPDDSGGKNSIQAVGSAVTYLQRYTLLAATGLATKAIPDDDGAGTDLNELPYEPISEEQWANLDTMISQAGGPDQEKNLKTFCTVYKVQSLAHLPAEKYNAVAKKLEGQIKKKGEAK
jgi:hypothetical protein